MFKNLSIVRKMTIAFTAILSFLILVSVVAFIGLTNASSGFTAYREMARDSNLAGLLQTDMLMVRMNVKDFIITGSDKDLKEYQEHLRQMHEFLADAQKEIQNPERAKKIDLVDNEVDTYEKGFAKVVELKKQRNHLVLDVLNVKGAEMEQTLDRLMEDAKKEKNIVEEFEAGMALKNLLLFRLYVVKFLDSNEDKFVDQVKSELADFKRHLGTLMGTFQNDDHSQFLNKVSQLSDDYEGSFFELVKVIKKRNTIISETLDVIGPLIAKNIDEVKLDIKKVQDTLGPKLEVSNQFTEIMIVIVALIALIVGIIFAVVITRGILQSLAKGVKFAKELETGDLSAVIDVDQKDEVGALVNAMRSMVKNLKTIVDMAEKIADGDLTVTINERSDKDSLVQALQTMVQKLSTIVEEIVITTANVSNGTEEMSSASQAMAQGATEQASSLEQISSSINVIESQARANSDNADQANLLVTEVTSIADKGNLQMQEMVVAMNEINEASKSISKIIKVIDEIAFQTNLLALNAAVEAARAGKQGKGFAVVAEEVRNLAARSAKAAKETSELIESSVRKAENGSEISTKTSEALDEIVTSVAKVTDFVGEISSASKEQALGISQVRIGLDQVDMVTQKNSASAEESASAAEELANQARMLQSLVKQFKVLEYAKVEMPTTNEASLLVSNAPREKITPGKKLHAPKVTWKQEIIPVVEKGANHQKVVHLDADEFGKY